MCSNSSSSRKRLFRELTELKVKKFQLLSQLDHVNDEVIDTEQELVKAKENYTTEINALAESATRQELELDELEKKVQELELKRKVRREELEQLEEQQKLEAEELEDGTREQLQERIRELKKLRMMVDKKRQELECEQSKAEEMEARFREESEERKRENENTLEKMQKKHYRLRMQPLFEKTKTLTEEMAMTKKEFGRLETEIDLHKGKLELLQEKNRLLTRELENRLCTC